MFPTSPSGHAFQVCVVVFAWLVWGLFVFFYTGGHICYQNVLPAVEQTISLTPVRLLVEERQEKKLALAGEVLVYISVHPGMLCGCLLLMKIFQEPSFVI